jgi:hypothetical protein
VVWAAQGWQKQASGVGYARQNDDQPKAPGEGKRKWNWQIWSGFLLAVAAVPSYLLFFARFPITRNVPWASWLMFAAAGGLLVAALSGLPVRPQTRIGPLPNLR